MTSGAKVGRRGLLAAGLAMPAVIGRAHAADPGPVEWRMVTAWPRGAPGVGTSAQRLADTLTAISGGRLRVTLVAGGELVPPFQALQAVRDGKADMAHGTAHYWLDAEPSLFWFAGVPFGLDAVEHVAWLDHGGGQALWAEAYAKLGVIPFHAGSSGVQSGGWFLDPIRGPADLQGLKMRVAGPAGMVLKRLGVEPVLLPPPQIVPALREGRIRAAEWIGPWNDEALGLADAAPYCYQPGVLEPGPALELLVRADRWAALPPDLQGIVATAARAASMESLAAFAWHNADALARLLAKPGVEFRRWPDDVTAAMATATRAVLDEMAARSELSRRAGASFSAFLAKARSWARWGELGMLAGRDRAG